jgi:hypothetical protein
MQFLTTHVYWRGTGAMMHELLWLCVTTGYYPVDMWLVALEGKGEAMQQAE